MKKKEKVSVKPDLHGLYSNFSSRTYRTPYDALQEITDNSLQAIRRKYQSLPEARKADFCGHIQLEFDKKVRKISAFDNGCGMNQDSITSCVALGRSEFRSDGEISKFGAGGTAATLSLSEEDAEIWFTSCIGEKFVSMEGGPRGTNDDFMATVNHGGEEDSGSNSYRLREFLKDTSSDSGTLVTSTPSRQQSYNGGTMRKQVIHRNAGIFHNLPFPIKFNLFGESFCSTEDVVKKADSLVHPNHETTFFMGGPNFEYEMVEFDGVKYGIRCSAALGYNHQDESGFWQFTENGCKFNQPQMTYHTYNGRIISSRSCGAKYFKTHGTKRSFALEVMTSETTSHFRINPEKTAEVVSEAFQEFLKEKIKPHLREVQNFYSQYSNRDLDRNEKLKESLESASSAILRNMRKSKTKGLLEGGETEGSEGSSKGRSNKSYSGRSNNLRPNDAPTLKRRSDVIFQPFHDAEDRDLIHDIQDDGEDGKTIFRVNTANEYVQRQIEPSEAQFDVLAHNLFNAAIAVYQSYTDLGLLEKLPEHYRTVGRNHVISMNSLKRQKKGK